MRSEKQVNELFDKLRSHNPELKERDAMIRNIMDDTSEKVRDKGINPVLNFLFGWTDHLWVRRGLVTISLALVFVFVFQQFRIVNRIGQLENRMVESNTEQIVRQQGEHVLMNSVIMKEFEESEFGDSLLVADKDLRELIISYSELQQRYKELKREHYSRRYKGKTKNQEL